MSRIYLEGVNKKVLSSLDFTLQNLSFTVDEGEMLMITGPTGSGKTTLLEVLACKQKVDSGIFETLFESVGYLSQEAFVDESLTVQENLLLVLFKDEENIQEKVKNLCNEFHLMKYFKTQVRLLSQGVKRLISFCQLLLKNPKLFILDEPTLQLDHRLSVEIISFLHEKIMQERCTVVMSQSDRTLHPFAHRILELRDGTLHSIIGESVKNEPLPPFLRI